MRGVCMGVVGTAAVLAMPGSSSALDDGFQKRVADWLIACFGPDAGLDPVERTHRFLEEALELAQAAGCTREDAVALVEYVFSRPAGAVAAEAGGVMVTLAGIAQAHGVDMKDAGEAELLRNRQRTHEIRAKRNRKPRNSPLPQ
jgi:NTP pyrophosphatase (non-canonical NTP hydrolase)